MRSVELPQNTPLTISRRMFATKYVLLWRSERGQEMYGRHFSFGQCLICLALNAGLADEGEDVAGQHQPDLARLDLPAGGLADRHAQVCRHELDMSVCLSLRHLLSDSTTVRSCCVVHHTAARLRRDPGR